MNHHRYSSRSWRRLEGVDPGLIAVMARGLQLSPYDLGISSGVRDLDEQRDLVESGASWTMDSRHLTGDAVDFYVIDPETGRVTWDFAKYEEAWAAIEAAAEELGVKVKWGGHWKKRDGPHVERA